MTLVLLVGRGSEQATLYGLLERARAGRGGALVVLGQAGIGKSTLLEDLARSVPPDVVQLATRGLESESELPFSGLADVLRPLLPRLGELPSAQRAALASALAVGEPRPVERFTVCEGTRALLVEAAENDVLLVVVDDFQWIDRSSQEALLYTARRLEHESVAFVLAARDDDPRFAPLAQLHVPGLPPNAAEQLLERHAPAPAVRRTLVAACAGNPLALLELPTMLSSAQLRGRAPLPEPLQTGPSLELVLGRRIAELSERTRHALLVAAALDTDELVGVADALAITGLGLEELEEAELSGIVTVDSATVRFRHPLLRSAAYYGATPAARRAAHEAIAGALAAGGARRAWHLAASTTVPNEAVARLLEDAGVVAERRSGYPEAARALERAAELSPEAEDVGQRLLGAARTRWLAGDDARALELTERALAGVEDPLLRADLEHLRGRIILHSAPTAAAFDRLLRAAEAVEALDPGRAALMFLDAAISSVLVEATREAEPLAKRAQNAARRGRGRLPPAAELLLLHDTDLAPDAVPGAMLPPLAPLLEHAENLSLGDRLVGIAAGASYVGEEYGNTRILLERIAEVARRASAGGLLAQALTQLALLDYRTSRWAAGAAHAEEAFTLAEQTGRPLEAVRALAYLARIEAAQGREELCREHAARAWELAAGTGVEAVADWHASVALGLLELGLGRPELAVEHLERPAGDVDRGTLATGVFRAAGDLFEAYLRAGDEPKARRLLDEFERRARELERPWALAVAARCRGLLADDGDVDRHFREALRLHEPIDVPFDEARTRLSYGQRLRRARRRVEARGELRKALAGFERLGARLWVDLTRAELAASGERSRARDAVGEELTAQELQVALLVAGGATNREAGASLFVSPKTIEAHLGSIYRKLGLRSRTELAGRFAVNSAP